MSKVAVGLSGGVDSSVTVHLLQEAGHEVVGIHLLLTPESSRDADAASDARRVADHFGIEFHILDARDTFAKTVIEPFADAYINSQTPNPCVRCNALIKFGVLWEEAQRLGCEKLATGHYVRIKETALGAALATPKDIKKDQSYFLWGIPQSVLPHIICPLGDYTKDEVRAIAASMGLSTASKRESQEICFIPNDDYTTFLNGYCPKRLPKEGAFVDENNERIGTHAGAWRYTIGQRRGLGLALGYPAYVIATDCEQNTVTVGRDPALWHKGLIADDVNFHCNAPKKGHARIKIRSRDAGNPGHWHYDGNNLVVTFDEAVRAITPGQSVVLYDDDCVIGGGIITAILPSS